MSVQGTESQSSADMQMYMVQELCFQDLWTALGDPAQQAQFQWYNRYPQSHRTYVKPVLERLHLTDGHVY